MYLLVIVPETRMSVGRGGRGGGGGGRRGEGRGVAIVSGGEGGLAVGGGSADGLGGQGRGGGAVLLRGQGAEFLEGGGPRRAVPPPVRHLPALAQHS